MKTLLSFVLISAQFTFFWTAYAAEGLEVLIPGREARATYQVIDEGKLLISVLDDEGEPIRGLTPGDFAVTRGIKKAKIFSAEPLETSKEVPLNIVLVVDNSYSMEKRKAVEPLLAALEAFFKTVRPIDNIQAVVFDGKQTVQVKDYSLHARTFRSNKISELRDFFEETFDRGLTSGTYLYEAMLVGVDLIRRMPKNDQKFLVVFSDGEDVNSAVSEFRSLLCRLHAGIEGESFSRVLCRDSRRPPLEGQIRHRTDPHI
jgi:hypothetical protein